MRPRTRSLLSLLAAVVVAAPTLLTAQRVDRPAAERRKDPKTAAVLSVLLPGAGSFYAGNSRHGVVHLGLHAVAIGVIVSSVNDEETTCGFLPPDPPCHTGSKSSGVYLLGLSLLIGNDIWSAFRAAEDARVYNARARGRMLGGLRLHLGVRRLVFQSAIPGRAPVTTTGYQIGGIEF